jgi:hypothetical protein
MSVQNQRRLFKEIIQFNPEKLQAGGGSGLGLWTTSGTFLNIYVYVYVNVFTSICIYTFIYLYIWMYLFMYL